MKTAAIELLGQVSAKEEADLLHAIDNAFDFDDGAAAKRHLAAGRSVYYREPQTPAGHVIRNNPDGSRQLVRFTADGAELVVSEPAAA
jgi:hypothetical protein